MEHSNLVLVIGENGYGQLGLRTTNHTPVLARFKDYNRGVFCTLMKSGRYFSIFGDLASQKFFTVGYNLSGQCGQKDDFSCFLSELKPMSYFNDTDTRVRAIYSAPTGYNTFYVTHDNRVFGTGSNRRHELGLTDEHDEPVCVDIAQPTQCRQLTSACLDMQCAYGYNLALCSPVHAVTILPFYANQALSFPKHAIASEIIDLIIMYVAVNEVWSTGICCCGANGNTQDLTRWTKLEYFTSQQIHIQKIAVGLRHSLFLDRNGTVYVCGSNQFGELGLGTLQRTQQSKQEEVVNAIQPLKHLQENQIRITDICCGWHHSLALDDTGNVWSWGWNEKLQCGVPNNASDTNKIIDTPVRITFFADHKHKVKRIQCGSYHSLVITDANQYFMFGNNEFNQCVTNDDRTTVEPPFCVNNEINTLIPNVQIQGISLGCSNTKFILQHLQS